MRRERAPNIVNFRDENDICVIRTQRVRACDPAEGREQLPVHLLSAAARGRTRGQRGLTARPRRWGGEQCAGNVCPGENASEARISTRLISTLRQNILREEVLRSIGVYLRVGTRVGTRPTQSHPGQHSSHIPSPPPARRNLRAETPPPPSAEGARGRREGRGKILPQAHAPLPAEQPGLGLLVVGVGEQPAAHRPVGEQLDVLCPWGEMSADCP